MHAANRIPVLIVWYRAIINLIIDDITQLVLIIFRNPLHGNFILLHCQYLAWYETNAVNSNYLQNLCKPLKPETKFSDM